MNITDVRVRIVRSSEKIKGIASITLDDCFVVHDIKIVEGTNGLFVGMPARKGEDGVFRDIAHPIEPETRQQLSEKVLNRYYEVLAEEERQGTEETP